MALIMLDEEDEDVEPMKPMKPMEPMKPMAKTKPWWPQDLGEPSASGSQDDMKYAFFPDRHRLLVQQNGTTETYDSGDHRISGVSQQQSGSRSLSFASQDGPVDVTALTKV